MSAEKPSVSSTMDKSVLEGELATANIEQLHHAVHWRIDEIQKMCHDILHVSEECIDFHQHWEILKKVVLDLAEILPKLEETYQTLTE